MRRASQTADRTAPRGIIYTNSPVKEILQQDPSRKSLDFTVLIKVYKSILKTSLELF